MSNMNFDIRVGAPDQAGAYPVEVIASPAGEMRQPAWQPFPAEEAVQAALDALAALTATPADTRALGRRLREWLFPPEAWALFQASHAHARAEGRRLRLRLRVDPPELSRLPWEYCYDDTFYYLALNRDTPLVRYIPEPFAAEPIGAPSPLRLLLALASPQDQLPYDGARERERIERAAREGRAPVEVHVLERATPGALRQALAEHKPHLFHFIGHGSVGEEGGALAFEDEQGFTAPVDAAQMRVLLGGSSVRVAILNACESAAHLSGEAIMGVAPALVRAQLPAVVAMQYALPDEVAARFARDLYESLALGLPLDEAVTEMRVGADVAGHRVLWGVPVLFMRAPDGAIWRGAAASPTRERASGQEGEGAGGLTISNVSGSPISISIGGDFVGRDLTRPATPLPGEPDELATLLSRLAARVTESRAALAPGDAADIEEELAKVQALMAGPAPEMRRVARSLRAIAEVLREAAGAPGDLLALASRASELAEQ